MYVSAATIWEVAIKQAISKLQGPEALPERIRDSGFTPLPIGSGHAMEAGPKAKVRDVREVADREGSASWGTPR